MKRKRVNERFLDQSYRDAELLLTLALERYFGEPVSWCYRTGSVKDLQAKREITIRVIGKESNGKILIVRRIGVRLYEVLESYTVTL